MILQALYDYYQRKASDPKSNTAPYGFEWNSKIAFFIVLKDNGEFLQIEPNDVSILVPRSVKRTSQNFIPNLFWDKEEYILGTFDSDQRKLKAFRHNIENELPEFIRKDNSIKAVLNFYNKNGIEEVTKSLDWEKVKKAKNPNITFKIACMNEPITCLPIIKDYVNAADEKIEIQSEEDAFDKKRNISLKGICSITGDKDIIARTIQPTFISKDAKMLVSFQIDSGYDSYGKTQAYNASIGVKAEFGFTTALKMLLEKGSRNKFSIAGNTILFWAQKQINFEEAFSFFFVDSYTDNPEKDALSMKSAIESIYTGKFNDEGETKFYILGLCQGGGTRIAIRFWRQGTVKQFAKSIAQYFSDLDIKNSYEQREYFTLKSLLQSIVLKKDLTNLPPSIIGNLIDAILDEHKLYPHTLQQQCIRRIRAEQKVNRIRAAILKAYLNRKNRIHNTNEKPITMALDLENTNQGYLCGRLFAVLEKIQEEAQPGINTTIKDRFYGAASATPITVFSRLITLSNHHISKKPSIKVFFEKLKGEIINRIDSNGMPAHLSLDDQSRFAIGYYHQRQDLFTSKENKN